jgi:hypothetical protein
MSLNRIPQLIHHAREASRHSAAWRPQDDLAPLSPERWAAWGRQQGGRGRRWRRPCALPILSYGCGPRRAYCMDFARQVVYLSPADKYHRLTRRLSQGTKRHR